MWKGDTMNAEHRGSEKKSAFNRHSEETEHRLLLKYIISAKRYMLKTLEKNLNEQMK